MSNFLKQGKRQSDQNKTRTAKKHVKEFYKILHKLDDVAKELKQLDIEITEDNIELEASKVMGRGIDSMEKFLLLGKLGSYENEVSV